jgi:bacteriocin-like protein
MTNLSQNQRVLSRIGARELSQDELSHVNGGGCGRPTSVISRDSNGIPRDITQD